MLRVGLTGGVGSGKSTVAALLAARGAAVLDADRLVEDLYGPGLPCTRAVAARFGAQVLAADGSVDRRALGALVLGDGEARRWLEALVHPAVRREVVRWLDGLEASAHPPQVAVVEAALLAETGAWRDYQKLVVVTAALALRRARGLAAGWSPERFDRTVSAQATDSARERVANYVVRNDDDAAALARAVDALWEDLLKAAACGGGLGSGVRRPEPGTEPVPPGEWRS
ncbi:MAG TPA: dephospho-CoA kinase [Thermoanaerobaculaceae bacterium]|nr:dephospho-CoA kinase [Thermoanaerobaculaceae bacterium]HPS78099.1 dephospho-CoA kinase [Thermoanaerobaculaceae bacterium]